MKIRGDFKIGLHGHFRLTVRSPRGDYVAAEFENLILNQGLDRLFQGDCISYCQVGTGNTAPDVAQTTLAAHLAGTNSSGASDSTSFVSGATPYVQLVRTRRFAAGTATGTLAEVGMGWAASGANLFSRALIVDSLGDPTTITVLADEALDVEYTLRIYMPTVDVTGTRNIEGIDYDYVLRASLAGSWSSTVMVIGGLQAISTNSSVVVYGAGSVLGAITGTPSGSPVTSAATQAADAYTPGTYQRDSTLTFGLNVGNASGGVAAIRYGWSSSSSAAVLAAIFQCSFDPPLPKDATKVMTLEFRVSVARV